jgi:LysM repeat protein
MAQSFANYLRSVGLQDNKVYGQEIKPQAPVQAVQPTSPAVNLTSPNSYTVKQGDTLSKIAGMYGVPVGSISGYKSGNPNLIYPGEQLSIGGKAIGGTGTAGADSYTDALSKEMDTSWTKQKDYPDIITSLKGDIDIAQRSREESKKKLEDARIKMFDDEYSKQGLGDVKGQIEQSDSEINRLRQERDNAILKTRRNPNVSAGVLAGEVGKITDYYNSNINNEIENRNATATKYNSILDEIDRKIGYQLDDMATEYGYWDSQIKEAESRLDKYEGILRDEMAGKKTDEKWEKELAQALQIANIRSQDTGDVKLVSVKGDDGTIYMINPYTGQVVETIKAGEDNFSWVEKIK